jgi:hypothetical protein
MPKNIFKQKPQRDPQVEAWVAEEVAEQRARYEQIAYAMNIELAEQREKWIAEFYERIQTSGCNWHADNKNLVKPEDIYPKPDREFKVVF